MLTTKERPKAASDHDAREEWDYAQGPITDWSPWCANFDEMYAEKAAGKDNPPPLTPKTAPAKLGQRDFPVTDNGLWELYVALGTFIDDEAAKPNPDPEKLAALKDDRAAVARTHDVLSSAALGHAMAKNPGGMLGILVEVLFGK